MRAVLAVETNGSFRLSASVQTGLVWTVEISTNLSRWTELATLTNSDGNLSFIDAKPNQPQRFHRLRLVR